MNESKEMEMAVKKAEAKPAVATGTAVVASTGCHRSTVYRHIDALRAELPDLSSLLAT